MASVIHFRRQLDGPPVAVDVPDSCVRNWKIPDDVPAWLSLRDRAMADQMPRARSWSHADFQSEMLDKNWWRSDWTWLATSDRRVVGSVTLAIRDGKARSVPVVHWLLVDPAWRRRGVAQLLIAHLER